MHVASLLYDCVLQGVSSCRQGLQLEGCGSMHYEVDIPFHSLAFCHNNSHCQLGGGRVVQQCNPHEARAVSDAAIKLSLLVSKHKQEIAAWHQGRHFLGRCNQDHPGQPHPRSLESLGRNGWWLHTPRSCTSTCSDITPAEEQLSLLRKWEDLHAAAVGHGN